MLGELIGVHARDAEVADLDAAVIVDDDVGRLDVAMHDALGMGVADGVEQLTEDLPGLRETSYWVSLEQVLVQRLAVHVLHHDIGDVVVFAVVVDLHDARDAAACRPPALRCGNGQQVLQLAVRRARDLAMVLIATRAADEGIEGPVDGAHPALAEDALDLVLADRVRVVMRHGESQAASPTFRRRRAAARR